MKKISANFEDKNRIIEWAETGASPAEIAEKVLVQEAYIVKFLESLETVEVSDQENDTDEQYTE
jgi:ribosomal protein S16